MQELYRTLSPVTLFSAKASAGYPNKNSSNEKIESPRGTMGRGKMQKRALSSLFPLPIVPRSLSVSLSPVLPTIPRGLCGGERPCHDRQWSSKRLPTFYSHVMYGWQFLPAPMYVTFGRLGGRKIKVRRYQFIVVVVSFFVFAILIREWSKSPTKCEFQVLHIFLLTCEWHLFRVKTAIQRWSQQCKT